MKAHPEASDHKAYGETISALGGDMTKLLMLDSAAYGYKSTGEEMAISSFTVGAVFEEFPTVYEFDQAKGYEFEKQVGSKKLEEFERALYGDKQVDLKDTIYKVAIEVAEYQERRGQGAEIEKSAEKLVEGSFVRMLSEVQVESGDDMFKMVEAGKDDGNSQDAAYVDEERGLFAVFDGVGGDGADSLEASHICAKALPEIFDQNDFTSESGKRNVLKGLAAEIHKGSTTGVIANVVRDNDGGKVLHFAAVGDSRLYVVHADGTGEQISHDDNVTEEMIIKSWYRGDKERYEIDKAGRRKEKFEGYLRHGISNSLDRDFRSPVDHNIGSYKLAEGDQIVLCSDGITGDYGSEVKSVEDVAKAVTGLPAEYATSNLMMLAEKTDDRTAIVVNV